MARPKPQTNNQSFSPTQFDLIFINQRPSSRLKSWTLIISPIKEDWVKTKVFRDVKKKPTFPSLQCWDRHRGRIIQPQWSALHSHLFNCLSFSGDGEEKRDLWFSHPVIEFPRAQKLNQTWFIIKSSRLKYSNGPKNKGLTLRKLDFKELFIWTLNWTLLLLFPYHF